MTDSHSLEVQKAVRAHKAGDLPRARNLILEHLRSHPDDISAWQWALKVAQNDSEKRSILTRILELNPDHQAVINAVTLTQGLGHAVNQADNLRVLEHRSRVLVVIPRGIITNAHR